MLQCHPGWPISATRVRLLTRITMDNYITSTVLLLSFTALVHIVWAVPEAGEF